MREASVPGWGLERRHIYRQHDGFQPEAELNLGDDGKQDSPEDLKDAELRMLRELVKQYQLGGPESNVLMHSENAVISRQCKWTSYVCG